MARESGGGAGGRTTPTPSSPPKPLNYGGMTKAEWDRKMQERIAQEQGKRLSGFQKIFNDSFGVGSATWSPATKAHYQGTDAQGNRMYKVYFTTSSGVATWRMYSLVDGKFQHSSQVGSRVTSGEMANRAALPRAKDQALAWLVKNRGEMSQNEYDDLVSRVENWTGSVDGLNHMMKMVRVNLPFGNDAYVDAPDDEDQYSNDFDLGSLFGGGGGGGGGYGAGPQYVKPDERVVEDMVKGMQTSLVGAINKGMTADLKSLYLKDHRRNFDTPGEEINPEMSVLEAIRSTLEYQEIHALRPDTEDERSWVAQRIGAAKQGGLDVEETQKFGIEQAKIGGDEADVVEAAGFTQLDRSGSAQGTSVEGTIRNAAKTLFRGVA